MEGEKGIGDKAYVSGDLSHRILTPFKSTQLSDDQKLWNRAVAAVRILVERINNHIKAFKILSTAFRHDITLHGTVFEVVCQLVNIRLSVFPAVKRIHPLLRGRPTQFVFSED